MSALVTGEAVALDLRTAALPSRAVAAGIDALAQLLALAVVGLLVSVSSLSLSSAAAQALGVVLVVGVLAGYPIAWESLLRGRTPGKAAMGLRVVRDDGGPIGFRQALVRGLAAAVLEKPGVTVCVLPVVVSLLHPRGKRVGDLLAGTVVLQERVPSRTPAVADMPPPLAHWASTLELSRLPDDLALSARQFVARACELSAPAREDLGSRLVAAVAAVTAPPPPPGTPGWAFLAAVLAERRRRDRQRLQAGEAARSGRSGVGGDRPGRASSPYAAPPTSYAPPPSDAAPPPYAPPPSYAAPPSDAPPPAAVPPSSGGFAAPG